jgi:hypothetical protein
MCVVLCCVVMCRIISILLNLFAAYCTVSYHLSVLYTLSPPTEIHLYLLLLTIQPISMII